jgi:hypothetical protein
MPQLDGAAILDAGTRAPAAPWGFTDLGTIAVGQRASLLALDRDPSADPQGLAAPVAVYSTAPSAGEDRPAGPILVEVQKVLHTPSHAGSGLLGSQGTPREACWYHCSRRCSLLAAPASAGVLGPWMDDAPNEAADTGVESLADTPPPQCSSVLIDGAQLPDLPDIYTRWDGNRSWGSEYLVDTLVHLSEQMAWLGPESDPITIGDISTRYGGALFGHRTHNQGVDADVGLYMYDGQQAGRSGFVDLTARSFDAEHTWLLFLPKPRSGIATEVPLTGSSSL